MVVPAYCRSRQGRVFRVQRFSEVVAHDRVRYVLRAIPIRRDGRDLAVEASLELDTAELRDRIHLGQAIASPEQTFEQLWQQLRLDLDAPPA